MCCFHLRRSWDKITQSRQEEEACLKGKWIPTHCLRKSMIVSLWVDRLRIRPALIGEMMLSQIVDHLLMLLKKKKGRWAWGGKRGREHKQTGIPRGWKLLPCKLAIFMKSVKRKGEVGRGWGRREGATLPWLLRSCYVVACLRALLIRFSSVSTDSRHGDAPLMFTFPANF